MQRWELWRTWSKEPRQLSKADHGKICSYIQCRSGSAKEMLVYYVYMYICRFWGEYVLPPDVRVVKLLSVGTWVN